ncbi:hypothetical protein [Halotalea alkalilenta]|uniref:hypothetical protein n=1 Tax=Halotalea alkalilenta TaxID=376489 RepID=UPI0004891EA6|nr:hypothetical protein [Halotalea alkalilenta]
MTSEAPRSTDPMPSATIGAGDEHLPASAEDRARIIRRLLSPARMHGPNTFGGVFKEILMKTLAHRVRTQRGGPFNNLSGRKALDILVAEKLQIPLQEAKSMSNDALFLILHDELLSVAIEDAYFQIAIDSESPSPYAP